MRPRLWLLCVTVAFFFAVWLHSEQPLPDVKRLQTSPVLRHLKSNPISTTPKSPAENTVAQMYVPEGFRAELIAAEPDVQQPVAFAFDERGRIWVAEAYSYPTKRPSGQGLDKIVIFEDRDGDGVYETRKVFAEGLNLISGLEVGHGGVWVGAAPELLFIPDRDHDDIPDGPPEVLLNGFGFQDTHECLNSFLWGPDGWLYGNQGVFNDARIGKPGTPNAQRTELRSGVWRYHPVRHQFEIFARGSSNPWGLDFDERGQLFMTHCRSFWGGGSTTHIIQGGEFWNQANANYSPYIVANPPADFPGFRNYLLASARMDHGAGGAGKPGTDAIYGGHSHVGTMIYLGDNWPDAYRGHLFTHNLGGHQMNHEINLRAGSGFDTVDEGHDQLFCSDPKYVAVDLQYGPDGAVYSIDWYDQQHCHNPNTESWDRSNGRIYRMEYASTYKPRKVDLGAMGDADLVAMHREKNEWFVRMSRRLLMERSATRKLDANAVNDLADMAQHAAEASQRLRAVLTLGAAGQLSEERIAQWLTDKDEYIRGWAIQFALEGSTPPTATREALIQMALTDASSVVRLYLATAIQRLPDADAWRVIDALAQHGEDAADRNLPLLLWQSMAQRMPNHLGRAFALAGKSAIPQLADFIPWYAATLGSDGLNRSVEALANIDDAQLLRRLTGLWLAMEPRANVEMPAAWKTVSPKIYASTDIRVRRQGERLAAVFGDDSMFPTLRAVLADTKRDTDSRKHAFAVLSRAHDRASVPAFVALLKEAPFRTSTINELGHFDQPEISAALVDGFNSFTIGEKLAALNTLTSRASFANVLLDAVAASKIKRDQLTALHVRQLSQLNNPEIDSRVLATWGRIVKSPAEKQALIENMEKIYDEAPLWAYDARAGHDHFMQLCASCHRIGNDGARLGPELTGAGKSGIHYFLENIIDPNAVIGADFQMTVVETKGGDVLSGLLGKETDTAVTIRTTSGESIIPKADIARRTTSDKSMMPEGLLESLGDRQRLELLKFLTGS